MVQGLLEKAKARFPGIELRDVNLMDYPEVAMRHGVLSTPALVIDGRLEFTGVPKEKKLLERLETLARFG